MAGSQLRGINIPIGAETTGLDKALEGVNRRARETQVELSQVNKLLKMDPKNVTLLAQRQALVTKSVEATREKLVALKNAQADVEAQFKSGKIGEEQYRAFQREIVKTEAALKRFETAGKRSAAEVGAAMQAAGKKMRTAGAGIASAGQGVTMGVTVPIVAAGVAVAKLGMDFDRTLSRIVGLVGISADQVNSWRDDIMSLSEATGIGPVPLAEALYYVTSAGVATKDAMSVLEASAKASAAGLGETSDIANAITSAMNAYGSENLSAAKATDILTAAVREGKMEASDLAPVMGQIVPMAAVLKVGFEQVAGAMAVMSKTGMDASESAVSLNAFFTGLLKPSKEGAKALDDHGLSMKKLRDMVGKPGGVLEVMRLLDETFAGNDEELAKVIPNVRSMRGLLNVLAQDGKSVDKTMEGVANSTGAMNTAFKAASGTDAFIFEQTLKVTQGLMMQISNALLPVVNRILSGLIPAIKGAAQWFSSLSPEAQNTVLILAGIAAAVGPSIIAIGRLAQGVGALVTAAGWVTKVGGPLIGTLTGTSTAMGGVGASSGIASMGLGSVAAGVGLLAVPFAIAAAGAWALSAANRNLGYGSTEGAIAVSTGSAALKEFADRTANTTPLVNLHGGALSDTAEDAYKYMGAAGQARIAEWGLGEAFRIANGHVKQQILDLNGVLVPLDSLSGRKRTLFETEKAYSRAVIDAELAQKNYNSTVKASGKNSAETKAAAWLLADAQQRVKDSAVSSKSAFNALMATQGAVAAKLQSTGNTSAAMGVRLQMAKDKVEFLKSSLNGMPKSKQTAIKADIVQAKKDLEAIKKQIGKVPPKTTAKVEVDFYATGLKSINSARIKLGLQPLATGGEFDRPTAVMIGETYEREFVINADRLRKGDTGQLRLLERLIAYSKMGIPSPAQYARSQMTHQSGGASSSTTVSTVNQFSIRDTVIREEADLDIFAEKVAAKIMVAERAAGVLG